MSVYQQYNSITLQPGLKSEWTIGSHNDEQAAGLYEVTSVTVLDNVVTLGVNPQVGSLADVVLFDSEFPDVDSWPMTGWDSSGTTDPVVWQSPNDVQCQAPFGDGYTIFQTPVGSAGGSVSLVVHGPFGSQGLYFVNDPVAANNGTYSGYVIFFGSDGGFLFEKFSNGGGNITATYLSDITPYIFPAGDTKVTLSWRPIGTGILVEFSINDVVHTSAVDASPDSPLPFYAGIEPYYDNGNSQTTDFGSVVVTSYSLLGVSASVRNVPLIAGVDVNGSFDTISYGEGNLKYGVAVADTLLTTSSGGWVDDPVSAIPEAVPVGSDTAYRQVTWTIDPHVEGGVPTHLNCGLAWYVTPTAAVAKLQHATVDADGSYADVAAISTVVAGVVTDSVQTVVLVPGDFYRIKITGTSGVQGKAFAGFWVDYS